MKYFLIVLVFLGFFGTVFAVPEPDPEYDFDFSDVVIVGKILSAEIISEPQVTKNENSFSERSGIAIYNVYVERYLKNPSDIDTLTVTGYFLREPHPMAYETYPYDEGQRVLLYLSKNNANTDTDLIIGSANSKVIEDTLCASGTTFVKGVCVDDPLCGTGTELRDGVCVVIDMNAPPFNNGDCLIATASYGSELAPQVQMLREIRDNILLNTESGKIFMSGFNTIYYSFSPGIAQLENENHVFKEAVKLFITPMIATLSIMTLVEEDSEFQVILLGVSTIGLVVGMYVVAPIVLVSKFRKVNCRT